MTGNKSRPIVIIGIIAITSFIFGYQWYQSLDGEDHTITRDHKSLAVLPFNSHLELDEGFFVSGITEDIRNQIAQIGDLRVLSRFTINDYQVGGKTPSLIGEELGVAYLLSGEVSRENRKLVVNCRLLNTESQTESWSETFQGEESDVFSIQNNIALRIAAVLQSRVTEEEREKISRRTTISVSAYNIYLQGRALYQEYNADDNELAISYFKEALIQDEDYALALAGLTDAYSQAVKAFGTRGLAYLDSAIVRGQKSVEAQPTLAEGWKALGLAFYFKGEKMKARECYKKSLSLNPNYYPALSNLAAIYGREGNLIEAISMELRSTQLDPVNFISFDNLTRYYDRLGMKNEAEKFANMTLNRLTDETAKTVVSHDIHFFIFNNPAKALELLLEENPDSLSTLSVAGICERIAYYYGQDVANLISLITNRDDYNTRLHIAIPIIASAHLIKDGEPEKAKEQLQEQLEFFLPQQSAGNTDYDLEIVMIYALLDEKEKAVAALEKALNDGYTDIDSIEKNKLLEKYAKDFRQPLMELKKRLKKIEAELNQRVSEEA